jgi:membrane protein YqaA with SNARE-associated domain
VSVQGNDVVAASKSAAQPHGRRSLRVPAFIWGFAEATLFFIVPDVLLTWIALQRGGRAALRACGWSLLGALLGGTLIWSFAHAGGAGAPTTLYETYDALPGISPAMIARAGDEVADRGGRALFKAALTGTPYKLYALQAGALGHHLGTFLFWSALARFGRFALSCCLALAAARGLRTWFPPARLTWFHALFWVGFYAFYFNVHRG